MLEEIGSDYEILQATNLSQILETVKANEIDFAIIDAHFPDGNSLSILPDKRNQSQHQDHDFYRY
jgi:DNA-binding response OmpR family regulator